MKHKIAIIGGSLREQMVADSLREKGYFVSAYATETYSRKDAATAEDCIKGAAALILPVRSNREDMRIEGSSDLCPVALDEAMLSTLAKDAVIYCGIASGELRRIAAKTGHILKEIMEYNAVAVPNAVLTAEGILAFLMEKSVVSLQEMQIAIFGYGRVGKAVAALLKSVGSKVVVFCRKEEDVRHGRGNGYDMRYYSGISAILPKTDYLINTVPSQIIDAEVLSCFNPKGTIIDIASMPGGVDLETAEKQQISSVMLHGIPGKYAPVSAGNILVSYYLTELKPLLGGDRRCD